MAGIAPRVEVKGSSSEYSLTASAPYILIKFTGSIPLAVPAGGSLEIDTGCKLWFHIKSKIINNKDQMGHMSLCLFESLITGLDVRAPFIRANNSDEVVFDVVDITGAGVTINSGDEICRIALSTFFQVQKLH
jgi:hypothetical protein